MNDNPKNRGRKHVLNKAKYNKNKPKANIPQPNNKSKIVDTNWDRYEEELTSIHDYVPVGSDFSLLANAPISKGSHFQFKAETAKNTLDIDRTAVDTSGLFNMDLNLIGLSLSTIPFNERCNIPDDYFSISQRNIMVQTARSNQKIFEQSLPKCDEKLSVDHHFFLKKSEESLTLAKNEEVRIILDSFPEKNDNDKVLVEGNSEVSKVESGIDKLNIDHPHPTNKTETGIESASSILETESLQQWLDDVLGD